jgi:hypothetical protein
MKNRKRVIGRICKDLPFYSESYLEGLVRQILAGWPDCKDIRHVHPRALCVAKLSEYQGVFAVPPPDRELKVADEPCTFVYGETVRKVCLGDWCALAYVALPGKAGSKVILRWPGTQAQAPAVCAQPEV